MGSNLLDGGLQRPVSTDIESGHGQVWVPRLLPGSNVLLNELVIAAITLMASSQPRM
jgi:hypothetical protein